VSAKKEFQARKAKQREARKNKKVAKAHALSEKKTVKLKVGLFACFTVQFLCMRVLMKRAAAGHTRVFEWSR
jgi:undecaprenyl pyrophosphate phosphatase UppP